MIKTITVCDVCGKEKQEVNHWWLFDDVQVSEPELRICPWDDEKAKTYSFYKHACGQECVVKAVNKFMQEQMSAVQGDSK